MSLENNAGEMTSGVMDTTESHRGPVDRGAAAHFSSYKGKAISTTVTSFQELSKMKMVIVLYLGYFRELAGLFIFPVCQKLGS